MAHYDKKWAREEKEEKSDVIIFKDRQAAVGIARTRAKKKKSQKKVTRIKLSGVSDTILS